MIAPCLTNKQLATHAGRMIGRPLLSRRKFAAAMIALMNAGTTVADQSPLVVLVQYVVSESSATRVDELLTGSVERAVHTLPRVSNIESDTRAGVGKVAADIEIHFEGGATKQDMALVMSRIAQAEFGDDVQVTSVAVYLCVARYRP